MLQAVSATFLQNHLIFQTFFYFLLKIEAQAAKYFMYRRPILCTLYGAVDCLQVLKIAVVGGGGGGCYTMARKKYWAVMYKFHNE
jgi:hypothetical protein